MLNGLFPILNFSAYNSAFVYTYLWWLIYNFQRLLNLYAYIKSLSTKRKIIRIFAVLLHAKLFRTNVTAAEKIATNNSSIRYLELNICCLYFK
jgi:hypothetical protein